MPSDTASVSSGSGIEVVPLADVSAEGAARVYATLQAEHNPLLRVLKAEDPELLAYGRLLYKHCKAAPSMAARDDSGNVVGVFMAMPVDELDKCAEQDDMGPCNVHLALCKHMQSAVVQKRAKQGYPLQKMLYSVYSGVLASVEGCGVFAKMHKMLNAKAWEMGYPIAWGFTLNQDFLIDAIGTQGVAGATKGNPSTLQTLAVNTIVSMLQWNIANAPASMQALWTEFCNRTHPEGHTMLAYDTRNFEYHGAHPFNKYKIAWVITTSTSKMAAKPDKPITAKL